jgi:hypothetical protein
LVLSSSKLLASPLKIVVLTFTARFRSAPAAQTVVGETESE